MLGYKESEIGTSPNEWFDRVHPEDLELVRTALTAHLEDPGSHFESEHRLLDRRGAYRWVLIRAAAVRSDTGIATRLAGSFSDITDAKLADPLTGLPNRLLFLDLLERTIKRAERKHSAFALLALGLDRFTMVNDSLGPAAADQLIVAISRRLQSSLRSTDAVTRGASTFTLARLGGDEFNVLVDDMAEAGDAISIAERLRHALLEPFDVAGNQVFTSAIIGVAVSDHPLHAAGRAPTRRLGGSPPREGGRNGVWDLRSGHAQPGGVAPAARDRPPEGGRRSCARDALPADPLLRSRRIEAFEALVRWHHPDRGFVDPGEPSALPRRLA